MMFRSGEQEKKEYTAQFRLEMASVLYVHTKRFVAEIIAFFNHFTQLQQVMTSIRAATTGQKVIKRLIYKLFSIETTI